MKPHLELAVIRAYIDALILMKQHALVGHRAFARELLLTLETCSINETLHPLATLPIIELTPEEASLRRMATNLLNNR